VRSKVRMVLDRSKTDRGLGSRSRHERYVRVSVCCATLCRYKHCDDRSVQEALPKCPTGFAISEPNSQSESVKRITLISGLLYQFQCFRRSIIFTLTSFHSNTEGLFRNSNNCRRVFKTCVPGIFITEQNKQIYFYPNC